MQKISRKTESQILPKLKMEKNNAAANTNFAMTKATGSIIKIILQDDYLFSEDALLNFIIPLKVVRFRGVYRPVSTRMMEHQFFGPFIHFIIKIFNLEKTLLVVLQFWV